MYVIGWETMLRQFASTRKPNGSTLCIVFGLGYFCVDLVDSRPGALVFNRAVSLRDSWAKIEKKLKG